MLTGSQGEATCKSQVQFIVTGDAEESDIRSLPRMTFHRGGIDSFVMTTRRSLGNLQYLRIWHDNTGESMLDTYLQWWQLFQVSGTTPPGSWEPSSSAMFRPAANISLPMTGGWQWSTATERWDRNFLDDLKYISEKA